ncbi:tautomerase family protein [Actinoallomurus sp. CA-150999]|uniref:tautomerase family protein n=1 Tax=Actinoallomurus sp. CA-150999 TaxID=3239887 RepID=UPI003D8DB2FB
MPLLQFHLVRGRRPEEVRSLLQSAHAAVVESFGVPERDCYHVVDNHSPDEVIALDTDLGIERTDRLVIIHVISRHRTREQKQRLYESLATRLQHDCGLAPSDLIVSITENGDEDWSFGHGRAQFLTGELQ